MSGPALITLVLIRETLATIDASGGGKGGLGASWTNLDRFGWHRIRADGGRGVRITGLVSFCFID